jgi:hypothetical protein
MCDILNPERGVAMTKDQRAVIQLIRDLAAARGLDVRVATARGKGSHIRVYIGSRFATVPSKVKTGTRHGILKQLDLA